MPDLEARCCVAGGGPAGMMLGYLPARAGIDVAVLEKHADVLRDFRGDIGHPSTMEVMHELGLLDAFLACPHGEVRELSGQIGDTRIKVADFSHLPTRAKFVAFMPQWDFLHFLAQQAPLCRPSTQGTEGVRRRTAKLKSPSSAALGVHGATHQRLRGRGCAAKLIFPVSRPGAAPRRTWQGVRGW